MITISTDILIRLIISGLSYWKNKTQLELRAKLTSDMKSVFSLIISGFNRKRLPVVLLLSCLFILMSERAEAQCTVDAGTDQTICQGGTATGLGGSFGGDATSALWFDGGIGGTFSNNEGLTPDIATWTPPIGYSGNATLTLTPFGGSCTIETDTKQIVVTATPTAAAAGVDQVVCGTTATLSGNTAAVGTGSWSIISGTGGTVTTPSSPTSTFTGTAGTTYVLRWTITNGTCTSTDEVSITLTATPTAAAAGVDQVVCGTTATLSGNTAAVGTGSWSIISGTEGTVTTPSSPTSTFTGTAGTTYVLRWTITNGTCTSTDEVSITFNTPQSAPTVSNANPSNVCPNTTVNLISLITSVTPIGGAVLYKITSNPLGADVSNPAAVMAGTYYIFYRSQAGCSSTGTQITVTTMSCPPDVTVTIIVSPNIMHGTTIFDVIVQVTELNLINTSGQITVNIPRDSRWILTDGFVQSLTIIGTTPVNNSIWAYSSDAINHIFTTSGVITAASYARFGFRVTFSPGSANGSTPVTSQLVSGSGGEIKVNNNADSEKIDFFHQ
jgi:hypothetical protein